MFNEVSLKPDEKKESLDDCHYIIQSADGYRFGADAVGLSKFALKYVRDGMTVFDLCSGCGIIGILIGIQKRCTVFGAEIDAQLHDMSVRSCALNGLENVVFYNADIRKRCDLIRPSSCDMVVCNPPFYKSGSVARKAAPAANSELTVTFDDIAETAAALLRVGGALMLVHTASRLDEILYKCTANGLMPKQLKINRNGKTFMLRAVRGGKQGLTVEIGDW